jgi:large subunit ribosomal protein L21
MYAVIETGSKQYKVTKGDVIRVELLDVKPDATTVDFDKVLLLGEGKEAKVGRPYVAGAKVVGRFVKTAAEAVVAGPKLFPTTFKRRKAEKRRIGHKQKYFQVTIEEIQG